MSPLAPLPPPLLLILAVAAALGLAACQSGPGASQPLARNVLACREAGTAGAIGRSGTGFQRAADDAMASGACRMFIRGQRVTASDAAHFVDPLTGRTYWVAG